jgi:type II secretory pathway pseudopilin PulG
MISQTARLCILQLQLGRKKATQGFTMIEVLVGILITLAFTATAMQAMVAATSIKVRADEKSESSEWIKNDFEGVVRIAAINLNYDSSAETYPISSAATAHRDRCVATASATGYASLLKETLDAMTIPEKRSATGNRQYTLTRTTVASSVSPFNVLQVTYRVFRGTDTTTTPISTLYTEVVPGASLACRQTAGSLM